MSRVRFGLAALYPGSADWIDGVAQAVRPEALVQAPLSEEVCVVYEFRISGLHGGRTGTHATVLYREVRGRDNLALLTHHGRLELTRISDLDLSQVRVQDQQNPLQTLKMLRSRSLLMQHQIAERSLGIRRSLVLEERRIDVGDCLRAYGQQQPDRFMATLVTDKSPKRVLLEAVAALVCSGLLLPLAVAILVEGLTA